VSASSAMNARPYSGLMPMGTIHTLRRIAALVATRSTDSRCMAAPTALKLDPG
jgi:hypothetical protein